MSAPTQQSVADADLHLLPLTVIRPDPGQPRRLLPVDLAEAVAGGQQTSNEAVRAWMKRVRQDEAATDMASWENAQALRRLANSVAQHGLINPITVRRPRPGDAPLPEGAAFLIVTGERRYWAHVLLESEGRTIQEGEATRDPNQIKVLVAMPGISVRSHQMIENLLREDINAMEKAYGLWALKYELSGVTHGLPDRDEAPLVPWKEVETLLDISKQHRIRLTSVLELGDEAQTIIARNNLPERAVRPVVQKLRPYPDLQSEALRQLVAWRRNALAAEEESGGAATVALPALVGRLLNKRERGETPAVESDALGPVIRRKARSTLRFLNEVDDEAVGDLSPITRADVASDLRQLRYRLNTLIEALE